MFAVDGNDKFAMVMGTVGPPHEGAFFATEDVERDQQWWMGIRLPDPTMTTLLHGTESPRVTLVSPAIRFLEDAALPNRIRRLHGTWQSSIKLLPGSFSRMKIQSGSISDAMEWEAPI